MNPLKTLAAGAAALWLALAPARAAEPLEINYGIPNANHATVFVAQDLGLFEKVGLKPKFFTFLSGAPLLAGLRARAWMSSPPAWRWRSRWARTSRSSSSSGKRTRR